jgi:nitrile hydratase subunit beta
MDGVHDLGGMIGFGPVEREADEPVFHEEWEGRVFGMMGAVGGAGLMTGPRFRHSIERMDPVHYLGSSYYEHWLTGILTLLVEGGTIDADELEQRSGSVVPLSRPIHPEPIAFDGPPSARFGLGDRVRIIDRHPTGHTRCPDYVRGHEGVVVRIDPPSNVPELEAHAGQLVREPTYAVRFRVDELWGSDGDSVGASASATAAASADTVTVDLYDRYLESQPGSGSASGKGST